MMINIRIKGNAKYLFWKWMEIRMMDNNDEDTDNDDSIIDAIGVYTISDKGAPALKMTF